MQRVAPFAPITSFMQTKFMDAISYEYKVGKPEFTSMATHANKDTVEPAEVSLKQEVTALTSSESSSKGRYLVRESRQCFLK